ncbi:MAG: aminopeptidase P family protein [Ruminococcaceae bacterium]|nr:aminopeptidase P family protein [Oscillospiraceae bacterium]
MNYAKIESREYLQRVNALRAEMAKRGVDLVVGFSNLLEIGIVRYYSGFAPVNESAAIVIPLEGQTVVCSGQASYDYCLVQNSLPESRIAILPEIGEVSGFEYDTEGQLDFEELFQQIKAEHPGVKRVGFIGRLIFPSIIMNKLKKVFADAEIVDFDDVHYEQRIRKSPCEIEVLKTNWAMASEMFTNVVPKIQAGMTERYIEGMFEAEMMKLGAESYVQAFAPMVATGPQNSYISMCRNTMRQIEESEIINLAAGVSYEGYNGIICSPLVLGKIPQKIKDAVMCAYDALNYASDKMKAGTPCDVVLNAYTEYLTKYGYIDYCPYGSLHSTGMLECEAPTFTVGNKRVIEENMAICIDAYFKGMEWGSFRIEDCYLIGADGAKRMTTYNDKAIPEIFNK